MKKRFLEAGKIVNTHGISGELKIEPWSDSPDFLLLFSTVYIDEKPQKLLGGRVHKNMLIARFLGVDDVSAAMPLKNQVICIDRNEANLPDDVFFVQDIIGAEVLTEDGKKLGSLFDVLEAPASRVYVVRGEREILIPAIPEFVLSTDADNGVIVVRLIEGM